MPIGRSDSPGASGGGGDGDGGSEGGSDGGGGDGGGGDCGGGGGLNGEGTAVLSSSAWVLPLSASSWRC